MIQSIRSLLDPCHHFCRHWCHPRLDKRNFGHCKRNLGSPFTIFLLEKYMPIFSEAVNMENPFTMRIGVLAILTFFGYQGPRFLSLIRDQKHFRDKIGNFLLGAICGAINGYMIFGTAWYFLDQAGYPFEWITAPSSVTQVGQNIINLIEILPPNWLQEPVIYVSVAVAFGLILIAFI